MSRRIRPRFSWSLVLLILALAAGGPLLHAGQNAPADRLSAFKPPAAAPGGVPLRAMVRTPGHFNGYTNYWHDLYWSWNQYGNLFQLAVPDIVSTVDQAKMDTAEELGLPGLILAEGFFSKLLEAPCGTLENPSVGDLEKALADPTGNLLVTASLQSEPGRRILMRAGIADAGRSSYPVPGHQTQSPGFRPLRAFWLENGGRKLFAVLSDDAVAIGKLKALLDKTADVTRRFDLHRGWFGTATLLHSVTCYPGHPLEVIGKGLNQGNDWFTFAGYMDFMLQDQLPDWLGRVGLDVVADVGTGKATHSLGTLAFGLRNWDGLKLQDMPTEEEWIRFVKDRAGYLFRPVFEPACDKFKYDGVIAIEGNKNQIDGEDVPFILQTGFIGEEAPPCMVLFTPKGEPFNRDSMWKAILERREAGILPLGKMLGPRLFRNALQLLWLDRAYLEDRFGDAVQLSAETEGHALTVRISNARGSSIAGNLSVRTGPELSVRGGSERAVTLDAGAGRTEEFKLELSAGAMARTNPILVQFEGAGLKKRTLAILDMPPAVSVQKLLYGQSPALDFPVSVHNFTENRSVPLNVRVLPWTGDQKPLFEKSVDLVIPPGRYAETNIRLPLSPGSYRVIASALGLEARSQIGVEAAAGSASCTPVDLNNDGIMEYRLENSRVRATLLATGARVIEYIVKDKGDNVFFKLWPEKEATDKRPFRERGFYPYGGFEDFLGQASVETHKLYDAEIVKDKGSFVQVRMSADYFGNRLEKIFTLYGDSPLLEVRFAIDFHNPELHMIGPQPILELGKRHWTEDVFTVPGLNGLEEYRMRPEEYYGRVLHLKEGWNAGYDTEENIAFVGAFPVSEPEFLHMWMNHPSNGESNHYYAELQPWVPIFQKTVRYFSYYMWASSGDWKAALEEMRKRNLITAR